MAITSLYSLPKEVLGVLAQFLTQNDDLSALKGVSRFLFNTLCPIWDMRILASRNVQCVSIGSEHSLLLTKIGELFGCGKNQLGQLGIEGNEDQKIWVKISDKTNIKAISAGYNYSLFLTDLGKPFGCGLNRNYGNLGLGGRLADQKTWVNLNNMTGISSILAGREHSLLLTETGEIFGCGNNSNGQLGLGNDQSVDGWAKLSDKMSIRAIGIGLWNSFFLTETGELWGCGSNRFNQLGLGHDNDQMTWVKLNEKANIRKIAGGPLHNLFTAETGELFGCGHNQNGQLGLGHNESQQTWVKLSNRTDTRIVTLSDKNSFLITQSGELIGCGDNENGQLGLGDIKTQNTWKKLTDIPNIQDVTAGSNHSILLTKTGELWGSGINANGQLGLGHTNNQPTWVKLNFDPFAKKSCSFEDLQRRRGLAFMSTPLKNTLKLWCESLHEELLKDNDADIRQLVLSTVKQLIITGLTEALPAPWDQELKELELNGFIEFYNRIRRYFKLDDVAALHS